MAFAFLFLATVFVTFLVVHIYILQERAKTNWVDQLPSNGDDQCSFIYSFFYPVPHLTQVYCESGIMLSAKATVVNKTKYGSCHHRV